MTNSNEGNNPSRSSEAVDGNPGSRWSSNRNDPGPDINNPHYLIVDLEEVQSIGQIKLNIAGGDNWNQTFSVLVSTDHEDWSIVASETDSTGTFIYDLPSPDVRYIKFESYYSEDAGQVNVYELEAYKDLSGMDITYDANVLSVDDARIAISTLDNAIDQINQERSYLGSVQNKLQFTMSNLSSNIQNIESSRSSIEDADFAAEAADLAKNQILAQSATAMLAQASAISQNILSLLR